jgi:hypothetical protein
MVRRKLRISMLQTRATRTHLRMPRRAHSGNRPLHKPLPHMGRNGFRPPSVVPHRNLLIPHRGLDSNPPQSRHNRLVPGTHRHPRPMTLQCNWRASSDAQCAAEAQEIIIWGCFNGHINEAPFCNRHCGEWMRYQKTHTYHCMTCSRNIQDYIVIQTYRLRKDYTFG